MLPGAYLSEDGHVSAWQEPFWRRLGTDEKAVVELEKLDLPSQARRWTALQAFNTQAGHPLGILSLEVFGAGFAHEFAAAHSEGVFADDVESAREARAQQLTAARNFTVYPAASSRGEGALEDLSEDVSVFEITKRYGGSLPELAHTIADYYGTPDAYAMARSDTRQSERLEGAGAEVACALGASSLDHLKEAWQAGMRAADPLGAGRAVLRTLNQ